LGKDRRGKQRQGKRVDEKGRKGYLREREQWIIAHEKEKK
jgi:hypothetical protein